MIPELEIAVLNVDRPDLGLRAGDEGVVVDISRDGSGYAHRIFHPRRRYEDHRIPGCRAGPCRLGRRNYLRSLRWLATIIATIHEIQDCHYDAAQDMLFILFEPLEGRDDLSDRPRRSCMSCAATVR